MNDKCTNCIHNAQREWMIKKEIIGMPEACLNCRKDEPMQDKKIIIDGVDVIDCEQFIKDNKGCLYGGYCENSDCRYKQLQRKEQENQTLKAENEELKLQNRILKSNRLNIFERLDIVQENKRYKQALERIEEICNSGFYAGINYDIENIINEVKDEHL